MAIDFPASPANGATHTAAGVVWLYDGVKWKANSATIPGDITSVTAGTGLSGGGTVGDLTLALATPVSVANGGTGAATGAVGPYLPIVAGSGNPLTGNLTINNAAGWTNLVLTKPASGTGCYLQGNTGANARWVMYLGDNNAESGSNNGSHFSVLRYADAGAFIDTPLTINRATGSATFASPLFVTPKGSVFGTPAGTVANGAVTPADANILLYNNSSGNWCGMGVDANGNFWLRTGLSGSPMPALRIDTNGVPTFQTGGSSNAIIRTSNAVRAWTHGVAATDHFYIYDETGAKNAIDIVPGTAACWNQTGTWGAMSDISTKRDVQDYDRSLADLVKLRPVMFKYNGTGGTTDDDQQMYGLVAQEVEPFVPEIILDRDDGLLGVDSGRLMFSVLNALREIEARLRALEE